TFSPAVPLVRATYVPEPKPVRGPYEVGVYYFPGWYDASRWQPIQPFPERTPMLGWYQEGSPEVADWHIKWAVEHGITFFAYDWYWVKGARSLEHGLHDGYLKARYRHLLKFCLLWANHNPKNTSSEEDLLNVTDYWIDHYFKLPEHLTIDGKPVVIIFSPYRLQEDMGSDAVRVAFEKMRARCRERGLPGLYLTACGNTQLSFLKVRQQEGYDGVTSYNWPRAGMKADEVRAPYDALVDAYPALWKEALDANLVKLMPVPLCGGWDSRPWHGPGALARLGMNPDNFKRHCADAKRLIDERKIQPKMVIVEAWNEWGEGSYIEPHKQFGFGYLDAIREVFTDAPKEHSDLAPQ
ncbi:MAG: hypothetical protein FJ278_25155, partial [Planctomycetes bacterium]|nr:hypothetical protein [Planctomycetota bacterium]